MLASHTLPERLPGFAQNISLINIACRGRRPLETLRWAREHGCEWHEEARQSACETAAVCGDRDMLCWLEAQGCEFNERVCMEAARGGHLELLQFLREEGCEWNEATCRGASEMGRLEVLRWAGNGAGPRGL